MRRFRNLKRHDILWAKGIETPNFARKRACTRGSKGRGNSYERKLHKRLRGEFGESYVQGPWIKYEERSHGICFAQPDALIIDPLAGRVSILEAKYSHCADAYFQTTGKYLPLIEKLYDANLWQFALIEVVKWFDPAVAFPAEIHMLKNLRDARADRFNVHIWKP